MDRQVLLSDLNSCYASIEISRRPELRGRAVAVCGDQEQRHGIVLAKSDPAKNAGVKTGMAIWMARQYCRDLIVLPPNMDLYIETTNRVREIYADYSDLREDFSIDESWLDITGTCRPSDGGKIANEIRERVKAEIGITVSIGVSWNKIFSKFGSEVKKPDAVTVINRDNYKDIIWPRPVDELFMVGPATTRKLNARGVRTIGDLAVVSPDNLRHWLGKPGLSLYAFANGYDNSPVRREDSHIPVKSIGNSSTTARDMVCDRDVWIVLMTLCESVGARLRESGFKGRVIEVSLRAPTLFWKSHQRKLPRPTDITREILDVSFALYKEAHMLPLRSIGVRAADLSLADAPEQLDLFTNYERRDNMRIIDSTVDDIRRRFGYWSIQRGTVGLDKVLGSLNAREEHTVHPTGYC